MKIQVNTDKNIEGTEELVAQVKATITKTLSHLSENLTRVEVHLSDEDGHKSTRNNRCMIEARLEGQEPAAVTCEAETLTLAVGGAADKLKSSLQRMQDQLHAHR